MQVCKSCRALAGEVHTPIGDGAALCCYLCAHDITVHGAKLGDVSAGCACSRAEIYPPDGPKAIEFDDEKPEPARYVDPPAYVGRDSGRIQTLRNARRARVARLHRAGEHARDIEPAERVEPDPNRVDHVVLIRN